jgi:hypothetical protein
LTQSDLDAVKGSNILQRQEEATNKLFKDLRHATSSDADTMEDLVTLVVARPENDDVVNGILRASDYSYFWMEMPSAFPMWYHKEAFEQTFPPELRGALAERQHHATLESVRRHQDNVAAFKDANDKWPRDTIRWLLQLEQAVLDEYSAQLTFLTRYLHNSGHPATSEDKTGTDGTLPPAH